MRKRLLATLSFLGLTGVTPSVAQQRLPTGAPAKEKPVQENTVKQDE